MPLRPEGQQALARLGLANQARNQGQAAAPGAGQGGAGRLLSLANRARGGRPGGSFSPATASPRANASIRGAQQGGPGGPSDTVAYFVHPQTGQVMTPGSSEIQGAIPVWASQLGVPDTQVAQQQAQQQQGSLGSALTGLLGG